MSFPPLHFSVFARGLNLVSLVNIRQDLSKYRRLSALAHALLENLTDVAKLQSCL